MLRALPLLLLVVGCGGPGFLDGVGFEVADAVYQTSTIEDARSVTTIVVSDAADLCARTDLAGHRELRIRHWESGAVEVELRRYDMECELTQDERAYQTWATLSAEGHGEVALDVVFRTSERSVSGQISADYCELPGRDRIGCD